MRERTISAIRGDARKLAKELIRLDELPENTKDVAKLLRRMELMPMAAILAKVPGATVGDQVAKLGVTRQAYYYWLQGRCRPSIEQANRIAKLTGIPVNKIRLERLI